MVNLALLLLLSTYSLSAYSQAATSDDPVEWYNAIAKSNEKIGVVPSKLVFTAALPSKGEAKYNSEIMQGDQTPLGFFKIADWRSSAWTYKLNKRKFAKQKALRTAFKLSKADTIITAGDQWTIHHQGYKEPVKGLEAPGSKESTVVSQWLMESFGWDGVVLAVDGTKVLVGSTMAILSQPEIQALAIEKSANKLVVDKKTRKGSGLLSLQASKEGLGIFDIVFLGKQMKTIPVGTKLIIEKKTQP